MADEKVYKYGVVASKEGKVIDVLPEASVSQGLPTKHLAGSINPRPDEYSHHGSTTWANYGAKNDKPTQMRRKLAAAPIAGAVLEKKVKMLYGNGLCYHRTSDLKGGTTVQRAYDSKVERFLKYNRIPIWFMAQCMDYALYYQTFNEIVMARSGRKIVSLYHKPVEYCRLSQMDKQQLRIQWLHFSTHFKDNPQPSEQDTVRMPLFQWDMRDSFLMAMRSQTKKNFGFHSYMPTLGMIYYPDPLHSGLFEQDGWIDVAANVPRIISAMQNNQVVMKYQINVPESYFRIRHPEWDTYTLEKRNTIIANLQTTIKSMLTGVENAYNSLMTIFRDGVEFGEKGAGKIEIIAIDDKTKKDDFVPSSNAADAQITWGLGLNPSTMGLSYQAGNIGAGSGSDQRESYNTSLNLNKLDQDIILEPLNFISEVNGWGVRFFVDHTYHTTTNNKEDGMQPSSTTITTENSEA